MRSSQYERCEALGAKLSTRPSLEILWHRRPKDEIEGKKEGLGKGIEENRRDDHQDRATVQEQIPWGRWPGSEQDAEKDQGEYQLGRDDIEHVCPDQIALFTSLQPEPTDRAALAHAEPVFKDRPPAAIGAAETERPPQKDCYPPPGREHAGV